MLNKQTPQNKNMKPIKQHKHIQKNMVNKQSGFVISFILLVIIIALMVLATLYTLNLNKTIINKFEGKRWNIPAKVYSRPLELYKGATVDDKTLNTWLKLLGYQTNSKYNRTGSFYKTNNTYFIHTRGFKYGNKDIEAEQVIKLTINGKKISSIQSTKKNDTGIIRLEPVTIGGIYPDNNEDRIVTSLEDIPKPLVDALIATEDRNFYSHYGVSIRGTTRAIVNNLLGKSTQGGSTLTQQLIKNFYLNSERSYKRKANEAVMALLLEAHYSKNEILQTYMNEINLGQNGNRSINGFGLASQFYFNRPVNELSIDQQALLVGIAKGPSYYNPRRNPERAIKRRNVVLNNMLVMGKLSQANYDEAIKKPLGVVEKPSVGKSRFPDFLDMVKRELNAVYDADDLKNEGLRIISTLDPIAQTAADNAVNNKLNSLRNSSAKTKELQGALVSADPQTGELVAVVGSGNEFTGFNRAVDAKRQVGSLLKPVIYLTALQSGRYNLASSVDDSPITVTMSDGSTWSPKNYDGRDHGYVGLTTALAKSYNQSAVQLGMEFGVDTFVKQLQRMGINKKDIEPYPSALLGSTELTPMDMLGIYQVFATGGFKTPIHSIRSVTDSNGKILQRSGLNTVQSIPADANYLTNFAMQQVVKSGTAKAALSLGNELNLAGKTGTTNNYRDAWFAGYSGNYVSVVWVGRDDNKPIGLSGSSGALPIWVSYMKQLNLAPVALVQPKNIEWLWLENNEGTLSNEQCPSAIYAPILSKNVPKDASNCAVNVYNQEMLAEQAAARQQQFEQMVIEAERERENIGSKNQQDEQNEPKTFKPFGEQSPNSTTNSSVNTDTSQQQQDEWYDKALEWF